MLSVAVFSNAVRLFIVLRMENTIPSSISSIKTWKSEISSNFYDVEVNFEILQFVKHTLSLYNSPPFMWIQFEWFPASTR